MHYPDLIYSKDSIKSLLTEIAALSEEVSVKQGEFIFREGEKAGQAALPLERKCGTACKTHIKT